MELILPSNWFADPCNNCTLPYSAKPYSKQTAGSIRTGTPSNRKSRHCYHNESTTDTATIILTNTAITFDQYLKAGPHLIFVFWTFEWLEWSGENDHSEIRDSMKLSENPWLSLLFRGRVGLGIHGNARHLRRSLERKDIGEYSTPCFQIDHLNFV